MARVSSDQKRISCGLKSDLSRMDCEIITTKGVQCVNRGVLSHGKHRCGIHISSFGRILATTAGNVDEATLIETEKMRVYLQKKVARDQLFEQRVEQRVQRLQMLAALRGLRLLEPQEPDPPEPPRERQLLDILNDKQSIHTSEAVELTKKNVQKILDIPVPDAYKCKGGISSSIISLTLGEVIVCCPMNVSTFVELVNRYNNDETIYEMGEGIYGRVLDGIWQFIRNHEDKDALCRILAEELKSNVGMCAQGNLTRLCNVLEGYLDGLVHRESNSEILQREFSQISTLSDETEKLIRGRESLDRLGIINPVEREAWLSAL